MDWINSLGLFIGSYLSNTLAALSGGGAGLLQFPLLIFLGLPFSQALATHKVASVALGLGAAFTHIRHRNIPLGMATYVTLVGLIGVVIGANIEVYIPEQAAKMMMGAMILGLGIYSRLKKSLGQEEQPIRRDAMGMLWGAPLLIFIGIINGSLAAGSGLLVTLYVVRWFGYSYKQAIAITMFCVGFIWNGIGGIAVAHAGAPIYWPWLPILLLGSFVGGSTGAYLANRYSNRVIKIIFEVITVVVGIKLLVG